MGRQAALAALAALAGLAASSHGQGTCPQLCGHQQDSADAAGGICGESRPTVFGKMEQCCPLSTPRVDGCELPGGGKLCRGIDLGNEFCNKNTDEAGCARLEGSRLYINMTLDTEIDLQNPTCCRSCTCYGDPNCIAFDGTPAEWVVCDARVRRGPKCKIRQDACEAQTDHLGNACQWLPLEGESWSVALQGSPCQADPRQPKPRMNMYKADEFSMELVMGERGVIDAVQMVTSAGLYVLVADFCHRFADSEDISDAWQTSNGASLDLVRSWRRRRLNEHDVEWSISDPNTGILARLVCTRSFAAHHAGPSRINVQELIEPDGDFGSRATAGGFCYTGKIDEKVESAHDTSNLHDFCSDASNNKLSAAKMLCERGLTRGQLRDCMNDWCSQAFGWEGRVQECRQAITNSTWQEVYCSSAGSRLAAQDLRPLNRTIQQCLDTIAEFSWEQAVDEFGDGRTPAEEEPVDSSACAASIDEYKDLELSECEQHFSIAYQDEAGAWIPLIKIPATLPPCDGALSIPYEDYPELFLHPVRIQQCELPPTCLSDTCTKLYGLSDVAARYSSRLSHAEWLVHTGLAKCKANPNFPEDDFWCLRSGYSPTEMCPCVDCAGQRPNSRLLELLSPRHLRR